MRLRSPAGGCKRSRVLRLDCAPFVCGSKRPLFYWQFGFPAGVSPLRRRPKGNENRRMSAVALWKPSGGHTHVSWFLLRLGGTKGSQANLFRQKSSNLDGDAKESRGRSQSPLVAPAGAKPCINTRTRHERVTNRIARKGQGRNSLVERKTYETETAADVAVRGAGIGRRRIRCA